MCIAQRVRPSISIKAKSIKKIAFKMTVIIFQLDNREPDLGARYNFTFNGNKLAVAKVWHDNMDCAHG